MCIRDRFQHRDLNAVDRGGRDVERRLFVFLGQPVQQVEASRHAFGQRHVREGRQWVIEELGRGAGELRKRRHQRTLGFIDLVQHLRSPVSGQRQQGPTRAVPAPSGSLTLVAICCAAANFAAPAQMLPENRGPRQARKHRSSGARTTGALGASSRLRSHHLGQGSGDGVDVVAVERRHADAA